MQWEVTSSHEVPCIYRHGASQTESCLTTTAVADMDVFHRAIITAHSCLLFEPNNPQSKKFLECVTPRLTANEGARVLAEYRRDHDDYPEGEHEQPPFELEMVEGALMVATGSHKLHIILQQPIHPMRSVVLTHWSTVSASLSHQVHS